MYKHNKLVIIASYRFESQVYLLNGSDY